MKKILLTILVIFGVSFYVQGKNNTCLTKEDALGTTLQVSCINNETNVQHPFCLHIPSLDQEIALDNNIRLLFTVERRENNIIILEVAISEFTMNGYSIKDFFKIRINNILGWYITQQNVEFSYGKWTIKLDWNKNLFGFREVIKVLYRSFHTLSKQSTLPDSSNLTKSYMNICNFPNQTMYQCTLESLTSYKKMQTKFLMIENNNNYEFTFIKIFNPNNKIKNFSYTMHLGSYHIYDANETWELLSEQIVEKK
jgi:hypothetical protein